MRAQDKDPWWLTQGLEIIGFEEDDDDQDDDAAEDDDEESEESETDDEENEDDDEEGSEDDDEEDEDDDKSKTKKSTAGLKSALRKERLKNRKLERQMRALRAKQEPLKGKEDKPKPPVKKKDEEESEESEASAELAEQKARGDRLARKLKDQAVDTTILKFADRFKDVDDVLRFVDRSEIEVDQDEDDPAEVEVDEESVEDAVKALAKKKPYLLKSRDERIASGSKMNGRKKKSKEPSEQELRRKYPALRR